MSVRPDHGSDPYKVLQVDPEADPEVIQAAYRRLAQKWHPDLAPGPDAVARMVAINQAWELIGEPDARAKYDAERALYLRGGGGGSSSTTGAPGRGSAAPGDAGHGSGGGPGAAGGSGSPGSGGTARPGDPGTTSGSGPFATGEHRTAGGGRPGATRPPEEVSRDWTSGRSASGHTYDAASMRTADGTGAAGPPPGNPSGSVLNFGRYSGWSLGEITRADLEYLEWLDRMPIGRPYRDEIDAILRHKGRRRSAAAEQTERRGLFRRR